MQRGERAVTFEDATAGIEAKATRVSRKTEKLALVQCCNNSETAISVRAGFLRKNKAGKIRLETAARSVRFGNAYLADR